MYNLKEFKEKFDPILFAYLDKRLAEFLKNTSDPFIEDFINYTKELFKDGKRLRPYLAFLMYKSLRGVEEEKAMEIFVAIEILHNFALMHDDIMDKSKTRHGVKTLHEYVSEKLKTDGRRGDLEHIGNSQAILVGDILFSFAMEIFAKNKNFAKEKLDKAISYFYKMNDEVVLGQIIDVDITTRDIVSRKLIEDKINLKTSSYSFIRPLQIGGSLAEMDENDDRFCENLGLKLGAAFQTQDDVLDIISNPEVLKKDILKDVAENQHTYLTSYIFENGTSEQIEKLKQFLGKEINPADYKEVQDLFLETGAIDYAKNMIVENFRECRKIIEENKLSEDAKVGFLKLIEIVENRKS